MPYSMLSSFQVKLVRITLAAITDKAQNFSGFSQYELLKNFSSVIRLEKRLNM